MTSRPYAPRAYAHAAEQFIAGNRRVNLWAGMGLGKTVIVETYLDKCYRVWGDDAPTLVLGPRRVVASTWPDESRKWSHLGGLDIAVAVGTPEERAAALRRDVPVVCINYDNLPWLRETLKRQGRAWPFKRVVADESTRLKNFRTKQGGARAKVLGEIAHTQVTEWINLTGTPAPNGMRDVWGQQWFIDAGARLGRTYAAFESRWFGFVRARDAASGRMDIQPVIIPYSQAQIQERLADCTLTIDPHDYFDLRAPIVNVIEVDLPTRVRDQYRLLERDMFVQLAEHEVEALNAAALSMKCLQFANGAVYIEAGSSLSVEVHDAKLEALESIVEEAVGAPVLVAYHFKSDLARMQRTFPAGRHLDADPRTIDEWNAGRIPVLFAHPESAGHGLNLQDGGNILVFFGQWWDLEKHDQIIERIGPVRQMQADHDRPVFIHYIVARDTVDELVMLRRESKRSVQSILLEAMKARV